MIVATDRIDLLRLFLRVAETGQVSVSARALGLSQPSASRLLKRLEDLAGAKLFRRLPQGVSLTQAGRDFLAPAKLLVDGWHQALESVKAEQTALAGTIRVAAPVAVGQTFLAAIAAQFLRAHPGVVIDWDMRDDAVDITGGGYDLWIRAGEIHREDLVVRHIYRSERAVVAAAGWQQVSHPRELQPFAAVRIAPFTPGVVKLTEGSDASFQLRQRVIFTTDNLFAARTAVLEGLGYAVLPLWCIHPELAQGALVHLCKDWRPPDVMLSLAYPPSRSRISRVAALIEHVRWHLQKDQGLGIAFLREVGAMESVTRVKPKRA